MKGMVLAALLAAAPSHHGGARMGQYVKGELAIRAARLAAPTVPRTVEDEASAGRYFSSHFWGLFDANNDGALDFAEWIESEFAAFLIYNERKDGKLRLEEFKQYYLGPKNHPYTIAHPSENSVEEAFRTLDRSHKGYIDIDDFAGLARATFQENDLNRDGLVTQEEISRVARGNRR